MNIFLSLLCQFVLFFFFPFHFFPLLLSHLFSTSPISSIYFPSTLHRLSIVILFPSSNSHSSLHIVFLHCVLFFYPSSSALSPSCIIEYCAHLTPFPNALAPLLFLIAYRSCAVSSPGRGWGRWRDEMFFQMQCESVQLAQFSPQSAEMLEQHYMIRYNKTSLSIVIHFAVVVHL